MDIRSSFIPYAQSPELVKPRDRAFHNPPMHTQAAAVCGVALGQDRYDSTTAQRLAMRFRIIRAITLHPLGPAATTPFPFAPQRRDRIHQRKQLRDIVCVRSRQRGHQRDSLRVRQHMMFTTGASAIGGIRATFFPPPPPPARTTNPQSPVTSLSLPRPPSAPTPADAASPTRRPVAIPAAGSSRSSRTHTPFLSATSPRESRSLGRTQCPSEFFDRRGACDRDVESGGVWVGEAAAGSMPTTRRRPVVSPWQPYLQQRELDPQPLVGIRLVIIFGSLVKSFF